MSQNKQKPDLIHEIFPEALCAAGCPTPWEKWCRGCNSVFCVTHVERDQHKCANRDQRPPAAPKPEGRVRKQKPAAPAQAPAAADIFSHPPGNGVASKPDAH